MSLVTGDTRLCDLINQEPSVIPVLNRFGITLGVNDLTMAQICREHGLDMDFALAILNTFVNEGYFPENRLRTFSAPELIRYLEQTNDYYLHFQLPNIERHFGHLMSSPGINNLRLIYNFFQQLKELITRRIQYDNDCWFPSILDPGSVTDPAKHQPTATDILIEEQLGDLRTMLVKHLTGTYDLNLCYGVLVAVITLETDIRQNNRIRTRILTPLANAIAR